ncbi:hypothetical protein [Fusobacterium ulcerans]|nr:hypothetical protein [Fusobacterium ulcerans]MEE0137998.1 hypothetical protein [Fusobacterium ulcerans]
MNKKIESYYKSLTDIDRFILSIDTAVEFFKEIGVDPKEATLYIKRY